MGFLFNFFNTLYVGQIQFKDDCPVLNCRHSFSRADPALGHGVLGFVSSVPDPCQLQKLPPSVHKPALTPQLEFRCSAIVGGLLLLLMALS